MKKTMKFAGAASVLALAVAGTTTHAAELGQLYFSQTAGFVDPLTDASADTGYFGTNTLSPVTAANSDCDSYNAPTSGTTSAGLTWTGDPSDRVPNASSVCVNTFDSTTSNTKFGAGGTGVNEELINPGEWNTGENWIITELIQENNVLSGSQPLPNPLWIADVLADFQIFTDFVGGDLLIDDSNSLTRLDFWETWNIVDNDDWNNCDFDPYNVQDPIEGAGPCADRYRANLDSFDSIFADLGGYRYFINFGLAPGPVASTLDGLTNDPLGLTQVFPSDCDDDDLTTQCLDAYTPEISPGFSSIYVTANWTVEKLPVPEPSVLVLFGAGILGLGLAGRRRKQRNPS